MKKYTYKVDPSKYTKDYYFDDTYAGSKQFKKGLHQLAPSVNHIYNKIPSTSSRKSFLNAGCGKGELLVFMKKKGYSVFGVDYSNEAVNIANKLMKQFHISALIKRKDVRDTSFSNSKFDYVISTDLVEHLDDNAAVVDLLNESYRVLKNGDTLYVHNAPNSL
jgi:2-polyprenyl-3-methyl-5-hydroxy-6-metoxy-1,4-benzoquinol methylase